MANFPFPDRISQVSTKMSDQRFITASYGDGYEQRAGIGINTLYDVWNIQINGLSLEDRNTFIAFWRAHGRVVSFNWTPPNGVEGTYIFNTGIAESNQGVRYTFSFELREVFE